MAGSAIGAKLALLTPDGIFQILLVVALPFVAFAVLRKRTLETPEGAAISPRRQYAVVAASSILLGAYDGFYGPGTGTFMLIAFTAAAKLPVKHASGRSEGGQSRLQRGRAGHVFHARAVLIALGLAAAVFSIAGNYLGTGMVMKDGTKIVRPIIVVVLGLLFVKVIFDLAV